MSHTLQVRFRRVVRVLLGTVALGGIFAYLSLDESAELHESLSRPLRALFIAAGALYVGGALGIEREGSAGHTADLTSSPGRASGSLAAARDDHAPRAEALPRTPRPSPLAPVAPHPIRPRGAGR
jgi:hypothetical protein